MKDRPVINSAAVQAFLDSLRIKTAAPTGTVSQPSADPVRYRFTCEDTRSSCEVTAKTWYAGRAEACVMLGAAPDQLSFEVLR